MIKINNLEIENVKRVKAVQLEPSESGLTIIGGNNNQGKTSVLDAIAWALGGDANKPSMPQNKDSVIPPYLKVNLSNGIVVERLGKNSSLKVTDTNGKKSGQQLLNELISQMALNLPKFLNASTKEKAEILLQIIGVKDKLYQLEIDEQTLYNKRLAIGQIATQKDKHVKEMPYYENVPSEIISASDLIRQQQEILAQNGENQRKRTQYQQLLQQQSQITEQIALLTKQLNDVNESIRIAEMTVNELEDKATDELEKNLQHIDEINIKVRANLDRELADEEAKQYKDMYDTLTVQIDDVRKAKRALLDNALLPLPGLTVDNGELMYNGQRWDNMSGSDKLIASTAIVRCLNPNCGFVLIDKLEQLDMITLHKFGEWLKSQDLQAIATRVSTGEECSIIIEDGYATEQKPTTTAKIWKEGVF